MVLLPTGCMKVEASKKKNLLASFELSVAGPLRWKASFYSGCHYRRNIVRRCAKLQGPDGASPEDPRLSGRAERFLIFYLDLERPIPST